MASIVSPVASVLSSAATAMASLTHVTTVSPTTVPTSIGSNHGASASDAADIEEGAAAHVVMDVVPYAVGVVMAMLAIAI